MSPEKWQNVKEIFSRILNLPSEQRSEYLDRVCAEDVELRSEVEQLLDSYDEDDSFLENSAVEEIADVFQAEDFNQKEVVKNHPFSNFSKGYLLNQRYEITRQIGRGGMGEVYLATDRKLNREVSLKVLHSNVASNKDRLRRFQQEAKAVSALNHPHIMTIYEFDKTADDIHFIVGEFIKGQTLNDFRFIENLSIGKVLEIAIQISSALSAAHEVGIVHRDIKPDNVMVRSDGYIKVLDFGLAKLTRSGNADLGFGIEEKETLIQSPTNNPKSEIRNPILTHPGAIMGTAAYMSPEQARGTTVDARGDLWSLGVVVYELLTGEKPFAGDTTADVLASVLREEPLPLSSHIENIPTELEWIISKTLSKDLFGRYQTANELQADLEKIKRLIEFDENSQRSLGGSFQNVENKQNKTDANIHSTVGNKDKTKFKQTNETNDEKHFESPSSVEYIFEQARTHRILTAIIGLLLLSLTAFGVYYFFIAAKKSEKIDSIAVLPFKNQSQDKDSAFLADGVSENLINRLSSLPQLKVVSRNSSFKFRDSQEDLNGIASKLGVRAIVTGSTRQVGDEIFIKYEVVDTAEDRQLLGGQYQRPAKDLIKIQNEIPQAVADQLNLKLSENETKRLADNGTKNPDAFRYYLNGLVELNGAENILGRSLEYFQKAVELDPNFAEARVQIASIYWQRANASGNPNQIMPKVREETEKALAINPELAEGYVMNATLKEYDFDWQAAEEQYKRAISLNPNFNFARNNYAFFLSTVGRHDEALAQLEQVRERDPINLRQNLTTKGIILTWAKKFDEALAEFQKAQAVDRNVKVEDFTLGYTYEGKGMHKEAAEHFKKAVEIVGGDDQYSLPLAYLAVSYAKIPEKKTEGETILTQLENSSGYVSPATLAVVYTAFGDKDKAIQSLEKAYLEKDVLLRYIGVGYEFDDLRQDQRFSDLLKRIGLEK